MPRISRKALIKKFKALGFEGPYSGGRHQFMVRNRQKIRIPNPHKSNDISIDLLKEILRQAGISKKEWDSLAWIADIDNNTFSLLPPSGRAYKSH